MSFEFDHSTSLSVLLFRLVNLDSRKSMIEMLKLYFGIFYTRIICKFVHSVVESKYSIL